MIERNIVPFILRSARRFPIVTVTGPRQSGKTTLCRKLFPGKPYVSLEALDQRAFAEEDPRAFLERYSKGAVLDEVQRAPDLLSYLQVEVDERPQPGRFVLTGSANFTILETVSQSLAGRTALATLLPLARDEYERFPGKSPRLWEQVHRGGFPAIPDRGLEPEEWFDAYVTTYVERDVRRIVNVGDLLSFQTFLKMLAGRAGQLLNLSQLGGEVGITHNTAKSWLSILEASFLTFRLSPFFANLSRRLVKAPKVYFYDTGLACFLLGIAGPEQLESHPLRGALFENWVISEILKSIVNHGSRPRLSFYRDHQGHEVDLLCERGKRPAAVEIKSGKTLAGDFTRSLDWLAAQDLGPTARNHESILVYGGDEFQRRSRVTVCPWSRLSEIKWVS